MMQKRTETEDKEPGNAGGFLLLIWVLLATMLACQPSEDSAVQDGREPTDIQPPADPVENRRLRMRGT